MNIYKHPATRRSWLIVRNLSHRIECLPLSVLLAKPSLLHRRYLPPSAYSSTDGMTSPCNCGVGEWCSGRASADSPLLTNDPRPCHQQHRVRPSSLREHRKVTVMLGPCCLCPLRDESEPDYVEAAIYRATTGPYAGQYVISCAQDKCGYLGQRGRL